MSFADRGGVLIGTRLVAGILGATKTDHPERSMVNPDDDDIYFTLANNASRTVAGTASPRVKDTYGHIAH